MKMNFSLYRSTKMPTELLSTISLFFYYWMRASSAVSDKKFVFKLLKTRTALREENLINDKDLLIANVSYLWSMKLVSPTDLNPETATLFYKNIEWCRTHIHDFNNVNCSLLKKIFYPSVLNKINSIHYKT